MTTQRMRRIGFRALVQGVLLACVTLAAGCGDVRRLKPAFEANQTNVNDMAVNTDTLVVLLEQTSNQVWIEELADRRVKILRELQDIGRDLGNDRKLADLINDLSTQTGQNYQRLRDAIAAATTSESRAAVEAKYPVLLAYLEIKVEAATIERDARGLRGTTNEDSLAVGSEIISHYPYYVTAVDHQKATAEALANYRVTLARQMRLAQVHAELFVFASESQVNIEQAFASILGDKGFEQDVLKLIDEGKTRDTASEAFNAVRELMSVKKAEAGGAVTP